MPKSRNRKDHKKKVQQRNAQMNQLEKTYQKMYNQKMIEHLKALHERAPSRLESPRASI